MLFKSLFFVAAAALAVNAQSECIISCSTQAAAAGGCTSFTDLSCVCTSSAFQSAAGACLQANCTSTDIAQAQALQQSQCSALSGNSTSATPSVTSSSTTMSASSSKTSATTSSGAATGLVPSLALNSAFGGLVALAAALVGAGLVM